MDYVQQSMNYQNRLGKNFKTSCYNNFYNFHENQSKIISKKFIMSIEFYGWFLSSFQETVDGNFRNISDHKKYGNLRMIKNLTKGYGNIMV
jgi:hypothetical protein